MPPGDETEPMRRQPVLPARRRPHTKSRSGCLVCKRRKVKCTEEHPTCKNCSSRGMTCEYSLDRTFARPQPSRKTRASHSTPQRILPQPSILTNKPLDLSYADLRFLHHFLTTAYPHLPAGNESVWTHEIPTIAEHRPYLMHALLGLGGSHLAMMNLPLEALSSRHPFGGSSCSPSSTSTSTSSTSPAYTTSTTTSATATTISRRALHHRSLALSGLSHALTLNDWSLPAVDSMLATAYALTFQATYLPHDGLVDFMTMVRGCALITRRIVAGQQQRADGDDSMAGGGGGGGGGPAGAGGEGEGGGAGGGARVQSSFGLDPLAHVKVLEGELLVRELFGSSIGDGQVSFREEVEGGQADSGVNTASLEDGLHALEQVGTQFFLDQSQSQSQSQSDLWIDGGSRSGNDSNGGSRSTMTTTTTAAMVVLVRFHAALRTALAAYRISLREAYIRYTEIYEVWWQCDNAAFEVLVDLGVRTQTRGKRHGRGEGEEIGEVDDDDDDDEEAKREGRRGNLASMVLVMWFLALDLLVAPEFEALYRDRKSGREGLERRGLVAIGWMRGLEERLLERVARENASWKKQKTTKKKTKDKKKKLVEEMIQWPIQVAKRVEEQALRRLAVKEVALST